MGAREDIQQTAYRLFREQGYAATNIATFQALERGMSYLERYETLISSVLDRHRADELAAAVVEKVCG